MKKDSRYYSEKAVRIVRKVESQPDRAAKRRAVKAIKITWQQYQAIKKEVDPRDFLWVHKRS